MDPNQNPIEKRALPSALGVPGLLAIGYGSVGPAVFYSAGIVAAYALGATPIAFAIAGLIFAVTALTYAEGASMFPESGGAAAFARHAFNDFVGFVAGWALLLAGVVTVAITAFAAVHYLGWFFVPLRDVRVGASVAMGLVAVLITIHSLGVRGFDRLNQVTVAFGFVTLAIVAIAAAVLLSPAPFGPGQPAASGQPTASALVYGVSIALIGFTGIDSFARMPREARNPAKNLPVAVYLTIGAVLEVTVGINMVAIRALAPHELGSTWRLEPMQGIAHALGAVWQPFETYLWPWMALLAVTLLVIASNAALLGVSRLAYSMGTRRQLPGAICELHPGFKTPIRALLLFGGLAIVLLASAFFSEDLLGNLADLYGFGALLAFMLAHAAVLALGISRPDLDRSFKVPFRVRFRDKEIPLPAALGFVATGAVWILVVMAHPWGRTIGILWLLGGIMVYAFHRQRVEESPLSAWDTRPAAETFLVPMDLRRILVPTLGTAFSEEMVAVACRLAKRERATVRALYIYEVPPALPVTELPLDEQRKGAAVLERAAQIGEGLGVRVELALYQGRKAGPMILTEAERLGVDVILMGLNPGRLLQEGVGGAPTIGKTVAYVLKHCNCRVLLSRPCRVGSEGPESAGIASVTSLMDLGRE